MASESVAASATQPESVTVNVVDARKAPNFFRLNATYQISPDATDCELLDDAGCLLEVLQATVKTMAFELGVTGSYLQASPEEVSRALYGVTYQLQMVSNMVEAVQLEGARS